MKHSPCPINMRITADKTFVTETVLVGKLLDDLVVRTLEVDHAGDEFMVWGFGGIFLSGTEREERKTPRASALGVEVGESGGTRLYALHFFLSISSWCGLR